MLIQALDSKILQQQRIKRMGHKVKTDHPEKKTINTHGDNNIPSGMLSSPHLAYCVKEYNIIENYDEACLGPVTYNMRIGRSVLTWEDGKKVEFELGEEADINKNIYTRVDLKPNSLTFVTTIEKFNLPRDIIARFNLKSKWVHEGLLLGTGPIVDPELQARLLIPLHNFSNQDITLNYGDEFISVEFTKTLNPDDTFTTAKGDCKYIENENSKFDFHKYRKRIGGKKVESSVLSSLEEQGKMIKEYKTRLSVFTWVGVGTFAAVFIGLAALTFTTWSLLSSSFTTYNDAASIVKQYKEQNIDFSAFTLKDTTLKQQQEIAALKYQIQHIDNTSPYLLSAEIKDIKKRIIDIEKKFSQTPQSGQK